MNINFTKYLRGKLINVSAEIINPEPEVGIDERDSFIEETTFKNGSIFWPTKKENDELRVAALEEYCERYVKCGQ